jgi:hypothetical protein
MTANMESMTHHPPRGTTPPEIENRLSEVSRLESTELDHFFEPTMQK